MKVDPIPSPDLATAAEMLKAMAHPMRIAILQQLRAGKKLSVTELHLRLDIEQSTASHHLGILRDKGVLVCERLGKNSFYSLRHKALAKLLDCLGCCAPAPEAAP